MPLSEDAPALIRANFEQLQKGTRARLAVIGNLTAEQLTAINDNRRAHGHPAIVADVVFVGRHVYESRIVRDGYTIDDVVDQISSAMNAAAVVVPAATMTAIENPLPRADRYGNAVRDRAIFECSARHPRPELFSVVPKGDRIKAKRPLNE
jgi:L-fucose mutarotase/ribose pyranase (RbsD/FucU family)